MNQLGVTHTLEELKELEKKSTQVVGWHDNYASAGEIRGPFNRWLTVSNVAPMYEQHVGSREDDAKYAAACMNMVPHLIQNIEELQKEVERLKVELGVEKDLLG